MERAGAPQGVAAVESDVALGDSLPQLPVLWWVPTTRPPIGVAWLQHGYARKPHYLSALAGTLAAAGLVVAMPTVESFRRRRSINDDHFLDAIGSALGRVADAGGPLQSAVASAGTTIDDEAAGRLVLVAHSAGCAVVARAAQRALSDGTEVRGIVLLDATDNLARSFSSSLGGIEGCPVRGVFARASWCNRKGQGLDALLAGRAGYLGVRLPTGSHCDAEGRDTDRVCRTMCGAPDPANVDVLFEATAAWTVAFATGEAALAWEPGGERVDDEIAVGRVETLYGVGGSGSNR